MVRSGAVDRPTCPELKIELLFRGIADALLVGGLLEDL
jgi:hypothetical protein